MLKNNVKKLYSNITRVSVYIIYNVDVSAYIILIHYLQWKFWRVLFNE